jgi:hypothetical protein
MSDLLQKFVVEPVPAVLSILRESLRWTADSAALFRT